MADILIKTEQDEGKGWAYEVQVNDAGDLNDYHVTLAWSDYDLWCRGQVAPERVVRAAFEFLLHRESPGMILSKFDCAVIRRYFPDVDRELPKLI